MNPKSWIFRSAVLATVAFFALSAAQAQPAKAAAASKNFTPEVGQAGKDVVWVPTAQALVNKLLDMNLGTRVAANSFDMGDWKPDQTARVEGDCESWCTAYLWIVPAKVDGAWKTANGELTLKQEFQMISGTLSAGDRSLAISNGRLDGERIAFSVGSAQYSGRVNGSSIEGVTTTGAAKTPWNATRGN